MKFWARIVCIALLIAGVSKSQAEGLNIFAAASMKTALDQITAKWKSRSTVGVIATYASSGTLAKQIEQAAPADIFISADLAWMDELAKQKLITPESRRNLAGNTLVLVAAKTSNLKVKLETPSNIIETLGADKLVLADIKSVPAGKYAKSALDQLDLWSSVESHVVMQDNVRSALSLVARGEAKLGVVYGSDAKSESKVEVVASFPESSHPPIIYPAAIIAASTNPDAAPFLDFLGSAEAKQIFTANGFTLLQ
jgi:molybdate transport system substrate-binding protein